MTEPDLKQRAKMKAIMEVDEAEIVEEGGAEPQATPGTENLQQIQMEMALSLGEVGQTGFIV